MARSPKPIRQLPKITYNNSAGIGYIARNQTTMIRETNPFGPQMACNIFGVHEYDDYELTEELGEDYYPVKSSDEQEIWFQTELPLENVRTMEQRHLKEIRKFERAYRKMALYALKWHYLMEDLEDNAQLDKMFKDIQLMRKLGGSSNV